MTRHTFFPWIQIVSNSRSFRGVRGSIRRFSHRYEKVREYLPPPQCGSFLAAVPHAENSISNLHQQLNGKYICLRQSRIVEELFDEISGVEALSN